MNKDKLVVAGVVLALILSGISFFGGDRGQLGANAGPEYFGLQLFYAGHMDGGILFSTTTLGNSTADLTDIVRREGYVRYLQINADNATVYTLPAVTLLGNFIPANGSCFTQKVENTGDSNLTIAAGAGMDLQEPGDGDVHDVIINANGFADVEYCRTSATVMVVTVGETSRAD